MRKSATTFLPRSTSTHLPATQRKTPSIPTFPHSTSHHDCRKDHLSFCSKSTLRSRSIVPRTHSTLSATTPDLARLEPILNNDTDALKIGDRVYLNGQSAGIILYIGETTLGPGDWAGVILDDASLGRTNGIVKGRCYFQTTNNRGIFSRLTKLTREQLNVCDDRVKRNVKI